MLVSLNETVQELVQQALGTFEDCLQKLTKCVLNGWHLITMLSFTCKNVIANAQFDVNRPLHRTIRKLIERMSPELNNIEKPLVIVITYVVTNRLSCSEPSESCQWPLAQL